MAHEITHVAWYLQYAGVFLMWLAVGACSIHKLATRPGVDRLAFLTLWAASWYLAIQTHWVMHVAETIPQWTELVWSLFETFVGGILLWVLTRK